MLIFGLNIVSKKKEKKNLLVYFIAGFYCRVQVNTHVAAAACVITTEVFGAESNPPNPARVSLHRSCRAAAAATS